MDMKRIIVGLFLIGFVVGGSAFAGTVALYDFEAKSGGVPPSVGDIMGVGDVVDNSLPAYNGNGIDALNTPALRPTFSSDVAPLWGGSFSFDGYDGGEYGRVDVPTDPLEIDPFELDDFTVEAWFKPEPADQWDASFNLEGGIVNKHLGSGYSSFRLMYRSWSGGLFGNVGFVEGGEGYVYATGVTEDTWQHAALTVEQENDNVHLELFLDGESVGSQSFAGRHVLFERQPLLIGTLWPDQNNFYHRNFEGLIDNVRISDAVLTSDQFLVPEPATMVLLAMGGFGIFRRRRVK